MKDGKIEDTSREPEVIKAFRDTWELGIHSYLAYLRDRLVVARELMAESGSIFVQIGDENVHLVRSVLDEVFGSRNFVDQIIFQKSSGRIFERLDRVYDVLLWYARNVDLVKFRKLYKERSQHQIDTAYNYVKEDVGTYRVLTREESTGEVPVSLKERLRPSQMYSQTGGESSRFRYSFQKSIFHPPKTGGWRTNEQGVTRLAWADRVMQRGNALAYRMFASDFPHVQMHNVWTDVLFTTFGSQKTYVVQTSPAVIERCLLMTTDPGDLVLDPTCGSGTTAYVAEQWGRRWITIDTSRVSLALARTRLMAARFPYYILADTAEGIRKESEVMGKPVPERAVAGDIRKGFVFERVPHITLKSIANNAEIDVIHEKW